MQQAHDTAVKAEKERQAGRKWKRHYTGNAKRSKY
jgi:hypothetical protein